MKSFAEECEQGVTSRERYSFVEKTNAARERIVAYDVALQNNADKCESDSFTCEEERNKIVEELANIPSRKEDADLRYLLDQSVEIADKKIKTMFQRTHSRSLQSVV